MMTLAEILEQRRRASADAYMQAQAQEEKSLPAVSCLAVQKLAIFEELDAFFALFDGCNDY